MRRDPSALPSSFGVVAGAVPVPYGPLPTQRQTVPVSEKAVLEQVRVATGDDTITDIAPFQPRGSMAAGEIGAAGGSEAGNALGGQ